MKSCDHWDHKGGPVNESNRTNGIQGFLAPSHACAAAACRSMPQHADTCRSTRFWELHMGVLKHSAACRSIHFFEFMCLSALSACSFSVCTGHILPAPCLPCLFFFLSCHESVICTNNMQ